MINIAICGASGKMGHFIADVIASREDCKTICGIDKFGEKYSDFEIVKTPSEMPEKPDVIIDFSNPSCLDGLLDYCCMNAVALVIGTTGYSQEEIEKINKAAQQIPVFFTFNMSLGINLLTDLAKRAAAILGGQFDIEIVEQHHNQKIDAPSGTAIMLANAINEELGNKYTYVYDRHSVRAKRTKTEIGMHAIRGGTIVGTHEIIFAGRDEVITLKHEAHSKQVFAVGSVNAACFLSGKSAGMYTMNDLIKEM
ncbi:MAG: 4-hydroxy-tetrahydrodipicolinate reductase [Ruminococcus sp.]|nr:4-hydroxy-tetrahydrodipicolinate reductase [Ruminococcus sp.]MBQ3935424.1 4-hydroxy-tetrahydrodipicolinate reductase [Ruminococcus sp.]